jgi:hypothetical protein
MAKKQGKLRLKSGTRVYGPMTRADLAELAARGRLKPGDEISYDDSPWMPAEDYLKATADLAEDALGSTPVPPAHAGAPAAPHPGEAAHTPQPGLPADAASPARLAEQPHRPAVQADTLPFVVPAPSSGAAAPLPQAEGPASGGLSGIGIPEAVRPAEASGQPSRESATHTARPAAAGQEGGAAGSREQRNLQIIKGSRKYPPMTRSQISQLLQSGRVTSDDLICTVGGPWMTIADFFSSRPVQTRAASPLPQASSHLPASAAAPLEELTEADVVVLPPGHQVPPGVAPHTPCFPAPPPTHPQYATHPPTPGHGQWPQPAQASPWAQHSVYPPETALPSGPSGVATFGMQGAPAQPAAAGFSAAAMYPAQPEPPAYVGPANYQAQAAGPGMPGYVVGTPGGPGVSPVQLVPEVIGAQDVVGPPPAAPMQGVPGFPRGPVGPPIDLELEQLSDEWCVRVRGVPTRLKRRHIKQLLDAGEIGADAHCAHMSWPNNQWKQLKDIPQLASLLRSSS